MKRFSHWTHFMPLALALALGGTTAYAREDVNRPRVNPRNSNRGSALCQVSSSKAELDINNVRAMVLNGGDMWWNLNDARYEVPKVTDPNLPKRYSIFAGSVWIGGQDASGELYVAAQTYRQSNDAGYWPGPLDDQGNTESGSCNAWDNHAKVNRTAIDQFRQSSFPIADSRSVPQAIREWPGRGNPFLNRPNLNTELAPFVDTDNDLIYDPTKGDYPDIDGDQAIWWIMNDVGNLKEPQSPAIGIELSVEAFAFETNDLLNNMTFYKQKIKNKRTLTLKNTYFGQWVDPDLGYFNDDYVGCDVGRGLGLCYNGDNFDEGVSGYGANPPTIAVDFFEGPLADPNDRIDNDRDAYDKDNVFHADSVDEPGEKIIMSNFVYYNNDATNNGNPTTAAHFYNYLRSRVKDGTILKFGGDGLTGTTGDPYSFMFPGGGCINSDPHGYGFSNLPTAGKVPPYAWAESNTDGNNRANTPADRRFLQSAGPFTLSPGAVNQLTIGVIWGSAGQGGPQGSNGLICFADDQAQAAFDAGFKIPDGPPAPIVTYSELDQQVVLAIQPAPSPEGLSFNTETYSQIFKGSVFKFEGYLVYQAVDANVKAEEVRNPDKARLVARGDVVNGVGAINNYEFGVDVGSVIPVRKVDDINADKGIFHTVNVTSDLFASGNSRLVNFKQYNYIIIAYAYSAEQSIINQGTPYLEGRRATYISVIPHKVEPEKNGTILNAVVGGSTPVKRIWGTGTGRNVLEITAQDESDILANNSKRELTYQEGKGPINVRIYDPKIVKEGKFTVKMGSRLMYNRSDVQGRDLNVGDVIVSTGQYTTAETNVTPGSRGNNIAFSSNRIDPSYGPQIQGRAIVTRKVSSVLGQYKKFIRRGQQSVDTLITDELVTLELAMLNDEKGGTFLAAIEERNDPNQINPASPGTFKVDVLLGYDQESRPFATEDGQFTAVARDFRLHDFWRLIPNGGDPIYADRPVSEVNEQLVPEYGLSISLTQAFNPGYQPTINRANQFKEASLLFSGDIWLTGVPYEKKNGTPPTARFGADWLLDPDSDELKEFDFGGAYVNTVLPITNPEDRAVYGSTYVPYPATKAAGGGGAGYLQKSPQVLYKVGNVDIVYTADQSKWTRVPVLQLSAGGRPTLNVTKQGAQTYADGKQSLNPDGTTDTNARSPYRQDSISRGMSWFPGYAIDVDRGVRLNMMFAEDRLAPEGADKGSDLKWEPSSSQEAGRNFVYVMDTEYDRSVSNEFLQDSLLMNYAPARDAQTKRLFADRIFSHVMWVGYPKLIAGRTLFQNNSTARVRLRVDRRFQSYPGGIVENQNTNPEYTFELQGKVAQTNQRELACKSLDLVRAVPNPYYAFSQYEKRQLDNIVKLTNLPRRCDIAIYALNGTLVRKMRKDDERTFIDWNLKNDSGLPVASGTYIIHVNASELGCEKVVKWFGVLRPIDLDTF